MMAKKKRSNLDILEKVFGGNGNLLIDGTSQVTTECDCYVVRENTVIAELTGNNATNELTAAGFTAKTLLQGELIFPYDDYFTSITLTSGSVMGYKRLLR